MTSTTDRSNTTTDDLSLDAPARICMPWCRTNDGHEGEATVDQTCWSRDHAISLETEDPVSPERLMGTPRDPVPYSVTYLEAPLGESTRVCVGFGELFSIKYTPAEARRLAAHLIERAGGGTMSATVSKVPLSEVPAAAIVAELARRRDMPPMERLAAGLFVNEDERLAYVRGQLAGLREARANANRWFGTVPHELPYQVEDWFFERIAYPTRRLWRRLTGRPEYDDPMAVDR